MMDGTTDFERFKTSDDHPLGSFPTDPPVAPVNKMYGVACAD